MAQWLEVADTYKGQVDRGFPNSVITCWAQIVNFSWLGITADPSTF